MKEDPIKKAQGARLRDARKLAGFRSARQAALENHWAESTYRSHEDGSRTIGQDDAERYATRYRLLGVKVTARQILFGDDTPIATSRSDLAPAPKTQKGRRKSNAGASGDFADVLGLLNELDDEEISRAKQILFAAFAARVPPPAPPSIGRTTNSGRRPNA